MMTKRNVGLVKNEFANNPDYSDCFLDKTLELERQFSIRDESEKYANLVNFSKNYSVPFYRWARYREGYSGELVKELISMTHLHPSRHYIVDPMCGSGSTLVASAELGYDSLGLDVNPWPVDLSNAKMVNFSKHEVAILRRLSEELSKPIKVKTTDPYGAAKYYQYKNYSELMALRQLFQKYKSEKLRSFLRVAWTCILEDCSDRKKDGNGLATRPSKVNCVRTRFREQLAIMLDDIENRPYKSVTSKAICDSITNLEYVVNRFSAKIGKQPGVVIFSPPYANSFNYFESYKIELLMGEYCSSRNDIYEMSKKAIRSFRLVSKDDSNGLLPLLDTLSNKIRAAIIRKESITGKRDGRTRIMADVVKYYFSDMRKGIAAISKILDKGAKCYIVVDQSAYAGVIVPTDLLLAKIAESERMRVVKIIKCRKANTSGQQLKMFPYLKKYLRESILVLEKKH